MPKTPDNISIEEVMRLANSPTGQQLIALLKATGGSAVTQAQAYAQDGNYAQAQQALSKLMSSPKVQQLLREMREKNE